MQRLRALAAREAAGAPAANASARAAAEVAEVHALAGAFAPLPDFSPGDEVTLVWRQDGSMAVTARGALLPVSITQPRVCRAIFDCYAGPNPVSARGRGTLEKNVRGLAGVADWSEVAVMVAAEHASRTK